LIIFSDEKGDFEKKKEIVHSLITKGEEYDHQMEKETRRSPKKMQRKSEMDQLNFIRSQDKIKLI